MIGNGLDKPISRQTTWIDASHNPEVAGSNPAPATRERPAPSATSSASSNKRFRRLTEAGYAAQAERCRRRVPLGRIRSYADSGDWGRTACAALRSLSLGATAGNVALVSRTPDRTKPSSDAPAELTLLPDESTSGGALNARRGALVWSVATSG